MSIHDKADEFAGYPVAEYEPATGLVLPVMPRLELRKGTATWAVSLDRERVIVEDGKRKNIKHATPEAAQAKYRALVAARIEDGWRRPDVPRLFRLGAKTWSVSVTGKERTATLNKPIVKKFKTGEEARADAARLIDERVAAGWVEVRPSPTDLREALVAAVAADPDDAASRNAFLDYLAEQGESLPAVAWRIECDLYGSRGRDMDRSEICHLESFLADPAVGLVEALVIGACWDINYGSDSSRTVAALIKARERLPRLRALFLGDILGDEFELSWIEHRDITGLFDAFPALEHFTIRGADGLELRPIKHARLKSLAIEASNLQKEVVRAIGASKLPALEHLEIWLGTDTYDANTTPADLKGILQGKGLPALTHLGLCNSDIADQLPAALAKAPILGRLRSLDLSMGTMTDAGAEALLAIPGLDRLESINLDENYFSEGMVERLESLHDGIEADAQQEPDEYDGEVFRYVVHAE
jgi:hypothetical protein